METSNKHTKTEIIDKTAFISQENPSIHKINDAIPHKKQSLKCTLTISAHKDWVNKVILLKNGLFITCSEDRLLKLWNIAEDPKKPSVVFQGHTDGVLSAIQISNGKIVSCSRDKTLRVWNIGGGKQTTCITSKQPYYCLCQIKDNVISVAGGDKDIRIYDLSNDEETVEIEKYEGHEMVVRDLELVNENTLASCSEDKCICIWDLNNKKLITKLRGHNEGVKCIKYLGNNKLASGGYDNLIMIWNLETDKCEKKLAGHTGHVFCLDVLVDGRLISGANDWIMIVWDVDTGKKEFEIEGHNECVNSIAVLSDGRVVSASSDQKVKVWE